MIIRVSDVVNVVAGANNIVFPYSTVFADTEYALVPLFRGNTGYAGIDFVRNVNGFTATVDEVGELTYIAEGEGVQVVPVNVVPLSRDWGYSSIWREIIRDLKGSRNEKALSNVVHGEKFNIINRNILQVVSRFYGLVQRAYTRPQTVAVGATDVIVLDALRIMRTGEQITFDIESDATTNISAVDDFAFNSFRADDIRNRDRIVWNYRSEKIRFKRGPGLATCGDCILNFPGVPYFGSDDQTKIDVPDGALIPLIILMGKRTVIERYGGEKPPMQAETMEEAVRGLYQSFKHRVTVEKFKEDVAALA